MERLLFLSNENHVLSHHATYCLITVMLSPGHIAAVMGCRQKRGRILKLSAPNRSLMVLLVKRTAMVEDNALVEKCLSMVSH